MATIEELQATYDKLVNDETMSAEELRPQLENLWADGAEELAKQLEADPEGDAASSLVTLIEKATAFLKSLEYADVPEAD